MNTSRMVLLAGVALCCLPAQGMAKDGWRTTRKPAIAAQSGLPGTSRGKTQRVAGSVDKVKPAKSADSAIVDGDQKRCNDKTAPSLSCTKASATASDTEQPASTNVRTPNVRIAEYAYRSRAAGAQKTCEPDLSPSRISEPSFSVPSRPLDVTRSVARRTPRPQTKVRPAQKPTAEAKVTSRSVVAKPAALKASSAAKPKSSGQPKVLTGPSFARRVPRPAPPAVSPVPPARLAKDFQAAELAAVETVSYSRTAGAQKMTGPKFSVRQSPFLGVRPQQTVAASGNMREPQDLFGGLQQRLKAAKEQSAAPAAAKGSFMDELQGLVSDDTPQPKNGNYVTDLKQLLGSQSDWIMTNGSVVDLAAGESEVEAASGTYVGDLHGLLQESPVASRTGYRNQLARRLMAYAPKSAAYRPASPMQAEDEVYQIPPDQQCPTTGGDSVTGLFQPINAIRAGGVSTNPPKLPREADEDEASTLKRPENLACTYMELDAPGYYFTEGYGLRRAPRNTHTFCHNPLYFEDPNLERCGQTKACLTTLSSAVHFTTMIALTPYLTTVDHPRDCVRALPDCPTCHSFASDAYFPEWSWKAAAVQAGAVTGLIFIIP